VADTALEMICANFESHRIGGLLVPAIPLKTEVDQSLNEEKIGVMLVVAG